MKKNYTLLLAFIAMLPASLFAQAPTLSYNSPNIYTAGTPITSLVPTSTGVAAPGFNSSASTFSAGLNTPTGVAADALGNIYVAEPAISRVLKFPAGGGVAVIIGTGFSQPYKVAADAAGNVYVVDIVNNDLKKILASDGSTVTLRTGFLTPKGVAVDAKGNVYVSDTGNNIVEELPAIGGSPLILGGSFFSAPQGLAVDAAGNLFVADSGHGQIVKLMAGGGSPIVISAGFSAPTGVAVDFFGNLFVADPALTVIKKLPAGGGAAVSLASGFNNPLDAAVDPSGNVYVADKNNNSLKKIKPNGGYYINALPAGLSFNAVTGVISGTPLASAPATNYKVTAYNATDGTAATFSIAINTTATLSNVIVSNFAATLSPAFDKNTTAYAVTVGYSWSSISFSPSSSDAKAAIRVNGILVNSGAPSGNIALNVGANTITVVVTAADNVTTKTYTLTVNRATQAASVATLSNLSISAGILSPGFYIDNTFYRAGVPYTVTSVTVTPTASSVNATIKVNGNTVISGATSAAIPLNFGPNTITVAVTAQDGVTIDNYVITVTRVAQPVAFSYSSPHIYPLGSAITPLTPTNTGGAVSAPGYGSQADYTGYNTYGIFGIAVGADGTVYVAEGGNNVVAKLPPGAVTATTIGSGFNFPVGVAVDGAGNVYVADQGNNVVKEMANGGGPAITIASGLTQPANIAVDGSGNIFVSVTESGVGTIKKIPPGGGTPVAYGPAFTGVIGGLAADSAGNLYVADVANHAIIKIPAGGGAAVVVATGLVTPHGLLIDPEGNIIVADSGIGIGYGSIKEIPVGGGPAFIIAPNYISPMGVAENALGKIYIADNSFQGIPVITPSGGYYIFPYLPAGLSLNGSTGVISGTPTVVVPARDYTVTAYNSGGGTSTTVNIATTGGLLPTLSGLTVNHGALKPSFSSNVISYKDTVSNATATIQVKPTTTVAGATITVNGSPVASGAYSAAIPLSIGTNTITIIITAAGSVAHKTYTVKVVRLSNNANLAGLALAPAL